MLCTDAEMRRQDNIGNGERQVAGRSVEGTINRKPHPLSSCFLFFFFFLLNFPLFLGSFCDSSPPAFPRRETESEMRGLG